MEKTKAGMYIWSGVNVALGALSFLMLAPGAFFWIGFACAIVSLVLGTIGKKSPIKSKQVCSILGIVLAVAGAACFVFFMHGEGYKYIEIL
ncbi:MAG: hypothetical protein ACOYJB_01280 [Christensenellaceae bacterium]|jgi:hypothetical protein